MFAKLAFGAVVWLQVASGQRDIFAFHTGSYGATKQEWTSYPWDRIATVCVFSHDAKLQQRAQKEGALYVRAIGLPNLGDLGNATFRAAWVQQQVANMLEDDTDGINIDFEDEVAEASAEQAAMSAAVAELARALHAAKPTAELSFDAGIRPCYEGRCYDYAALGAAVDRLFVMAYDTNDFDDAPPDNDHTFANSALRVVNASLHDFRSAGVPIEKIVLGLPWYGYRYIRILGQHITGEQVGLRDILPLLAEGSGWERKFDADSQTPYLVKGMREIWYDDAGSLQQKARLAGSLGVVQLGMWTANAIDYDQTGVAASFWDAMSLNGEEVSV